MLVIIGVFAFIGFLLMINWALVKLARIATGQK